MQDSEGGPKVGDIGNQGDGTNDALTGANLGTFPDGKLVTASWWFFDDSGTNAGRFFEGTSRFSWRSSASESYRVIMKNSAGGTTLDAIGSANDIPLGQWVHIIISVDMANESGSLVFIDDVDLTPAFSVFVNEDIDFSIMDGSGIGFFSDRSANVKLEGRMSQIWIANEYIDLSVEANRRLFYSSAGKPVDLGSDGSTPTGTQPFYFLPEASATNAGSFDDLIVTGAFVEVAGPGA